MCGISGIFSNQIRENIKQKAFKMANLLSHRGPDDTGIFDTEKIILIHKRLSIVDISGGHQPIVNDDLVLIANGEIYNDLEIRNENKDFKFKTGSDCESILCVYKKFGIEGFKKLRGMFAFAIYENKTQRLILGRDPFGIKPLYFSITNDNFIFSSELQSIIKSNLVKKNILESKIKELLQIQFCSGRETIFNNIFRIRNGEILIVKKAKIIKSILYNKLQNFNKKIKSNKEKKKLLENSVKLHQRSDVPYGIFFSGGIDSTLVLYLMSKVNTKKINSYSIVFSGHKDRKDYLKNITERLNSKIRILDFSKEDFWRLLPLVANSLDDPIIDYASIPTFKLAEEASKEVKVVLTGEGGDELFGGYGRYRTGTRIFFKREFLKKGTFNNFLNFRNYFLNWDENIISTKERLKNLNLSPLQKLQYFDYEEWLPNDLLIKLDRCLMAFSLEGRTPLIDINLFRNFFGEDDNLKIRGGYGKYYIRKFLSQNIRGYNAFSKKEGFTVPINSWIPKEYKFLCQTLPKVKCIKEFFPSNKIKELCMSLGSSKKAIIPVWRILFFALWYILNFENKKIEGDTFDILNDNI